MKSNSPGALAQARRASGAALRRAALWFAAGFGGSALLVALIAWIATLITGDTTPLALPALLVAVALGVAVGWAAALASLTLETLRRVEAGIEAATGRRAR
ncbi:MAG TPA: hypothetical protein VF808_13645 [Ktedonobacterales bacterium]